MNEEAVAPAIETARTSVPEIVKQISIQDALIVEGLLAIKLSVGYESLDQLSASLLKNLHQNSQETRRRYIQSITRWFFPDGIAGLFFVAFFVGPTAIIKSCVRP